MTATRFEIVRDAPKSDHVKVSNGDDTQATITIPPGEVIEIR